MTASSEINVFDEGLDFCVLFCLGVLPLWILGLTCWSHMYYVVPPHGSARSTLMLLGCPPRESGVILDR